MRPLLAALLQLGLVARLASSAAVVDPTTLRGKVRPPPWLAFRPCFDLCCRARCQGSHQALSAACQTAGLPALTADLHQVLFGYQGWFDNPRSGSQGEGAGGSWGHWCDGCGSHGVPNATNVHPDVFPDMSEFPAAAMAPSGFTNRSDGSVVQLYSEFEHATQEVHFRW
jgi:hypothetical protein